MRHGNLLIGSIVYAVTLSCICVLGLIGCGRSDGPEALTILTSSLPDGTVNQPYSTSVSGSGGTTPYTWSVTPPLPPNLGFNTTTGAITGTPKTAGTSSHTFTLHDSSTDLPPVQRSLALTINPPNSPPTITTATLPGGTVGLAYDQPVQASGGTGVLTWSIDVGTLPQGLSLNPTTGRIFGTPTAAGTSPFTVRVADTVGQTDTQALSILIITPPILPTITTTLLPDGTVNQPYSTSVSGSGGVPPYTWSVTPALPPNLALDTTTGAITGTPITEGTSSHTFTLHDSLSPPQTVQSSLTLTINPMLSITTPSLPDGTVNQPYSTSVSGSGGVPPYTWSVTPPLPANLGFDTTTGAITGTPITEGTSSHTFTLHDSLSPPQTVQSSLTLTINPTVAALSITTTTLPGGTVGLAYSEGLQATGGTGILVWSSGGSLPANLTLSPAGIISGTPTNTGTSNFTVMVTDGSQSDSQNLSIDVSAALKITTTSLPDATVDHSYSPTLERSGGVAPFTWSVTPALPAGLNLDTSTGKISGIPEAGTEGTYSLTFTVQDSSTPTPQTDSTVLSLTIKP
jgi:putative Ig domain-containing protein